MKKKIILFLSFLMIAMCLTGCSKEYVIQGEKLKEIREIANNVVTQKGYELPEGYKVSLPNDTTNAQIKIRYHMSPTEYVDVIFDISTEEIKLVEISTYSVLDGVIIMIVFIIVGCVCLIYLIISSIKWIYKKIKNKIKAKKELKEE